MRGFVFLVAFWTSAIPAAVHNLLVGTFSTNSIYTISFDDETYELTELANTSTPVGSSWLTLSVSVFSVEEESRLPQSLSTKRR